MLKLPYPIACHFLLTTMTIGGYLRKILMKRVVLMNFFCHY
ncbi:putative membrane protein [Escherichia coli]|nr:putative membrane protein [Escherichia coli]